MRILLTGATGFIGGWLIRGLQSSGHEVHALVRPSTNTELLALRGVPSWVDDGVRDLGPVLVSRGPFDGVIHLASLFLATHTAMDIAPLITSNVMFPVRVVDACVRAGVRWFVNTGTTWQHYEGQEYSPVNLYSATKQAFESLAQYYVEAFDLRLVTLVLGDTYGPNDGRRKLLNLWCRIAQSDSPLEMSDGWQQIDPVFSSDVADAFVRAVELLQCGNWPEKKMSSFLVSSKAPISLRDLAGVFEDVVGKKLLIRWGGRPMRPREVLVPWEGAPVVDGWQPRVTLREGIGRLWLSTQCRKDGAEA